MEISKTTEKDIVLLNKYLLTMWAVVGCVAGIVRFLEGKTELVSALVFLGCLLFPFGICLLVGRKHPGQKALPYLGILGFSILYGYLCISSLDPFTCVMFVPFLYLLALYRNKRIYDLATVCFLAINCLMIAIRLLRGGGVLVFPQIAVVLVSLAGGYLVLAAMDRIFELFRSRNSELLSAEVERIVKEERYKFAYQDTLTGLGNRNAYQEKLESFQEDETRVTCVVMVDVNGLKTANDLLGQSAGDELLLGMTDCLQRVFEEENSIFRVGGDEFVIFTELPEDEVQEKLKVLEALVEEWRGAHIRDLSAAIGYAFSSELAGQPLYEVIKLADERMYTNKRAHYSSSKHDRRHR